MSAEASQEAFVDHEDVDLVLGGSPVPPRVKAGEVDPLTRHYFYSAGERELKTRARDVGYSSVLPGFLVPLNPFRINVPNDTIESLFDRNAATEMEREITPRDQADALMTRYQHRGGRILFPLTGMEGDAGLARATKLFKLIHPPIKCSRGYEQFKRTSAGPVITCIFCRLEELRSDAWMKRVVGAGLSQEASIPYGLDGDGELRLISEEEACEIMHGLTLSANEELFIHMIDTLQQSKADVEAGRMGPGKKKFDKRDEWYFLNTHTVSDQLQAAENARGGNVADIVGQTLRAVREESSVPSFDAQRLLGEQEARHKREMAELEKRIFAKLKGKAKDEEKQG